MKQIFLTLTLILLGFTALFSQSSVYEIKGKGTKFYIGGSVHILREQDYPLPEEFDKAFDNSEILVLETNLKEMEEPENAKIMLGYTLLPNDKTLKTLLDEEVYNELDTACKNAGFNLIQMNHFKPIIPLLTLTRIELNKMGVNTSGVDKHYLNRAIEKNKKMLFLEELEFQMKLLANSGEGNENEFVKYSLKDLNDQQDMYEELIISWKDGIAKPMLKLIIEFKTDFPELYKSLLVDRNNNWLPQLEGYLETEEVEFVVVGALHLYGSDGVLQQLKDLGYKVKQLQL